MITKAGCVVVGAHSLDTLNASLKQVWTGRKTETATAQLAEIAAVKLGVDSSTAYKVGLTVDLAVPFILPQPRVLQEWPRYILVVSG